MTNRTRTRLLDRTAGTYTYWFRNAWQIVYHEEHRKRETVSDQVLPGNGHNFDLVRTEFIKGVPVIDGDPVELGGNRAIMANKPVGRFSSLDYFAAHSAVGGDPSDMAAATELVAKTNPSRPHVDVFAFIAELREVPQLLLKRSDDIGRDISRGRLSNEFGWKPLINDLVSILDFKLAFDHRLRELDHLYRSGIRRKRKLFSGTSVPVNLYNGPLNRDRTCSIDGRMDGVTTAEVWGFCKWRPTGRSPSWLPRIHSTSITEKALLAIMGAGEYGIDAATIWNLVPFTWLADWCTNAGDFLEASRNVVGATPSDIQIMRHYHTEFTHQITVLTPGYSVSPLHPVKHHDSFRRRPIASLSVEAHFPFLNERKAAILADVMHNLFRPNRVSGKKGFITRFKGGKYNPLNPEWSNVTPTD